MKRLSDVIVENRAELISENDPQFNEMGDSAVRKHNYNVLVELIEYDKKLMMVDWAFAMAGFGADVDDDSFLLPDEGSSAVCDLFDLAEDFAMQIGD